MRWPWLHPPWSRLLLPRSLLGLPRGPCRRLRLGLSGMAAVLVAEQLKIVAMQPEIQEEIQMAEQLDVGAMQSRSQEELRLI